MKKIGFIGIGRMGGPMAKNLVKAGFPVTVYDIDPAKMKALGREGAARAGSLREVALGSDVVISMLLTGSQVREVYLGRNAVLDNLPPGSSVIDMSTIEPEASKEIAAEAEARGMKMLDAPVMGSVGASESATLVITVGGEEEVFKEHLEIFRALGSQVFYMGGHGAGLCMKLATNHMHFICHGALAESLNLGRRMGLDPGYMVDVMAVGAVPKLLELKGHPMADGDFTPTAPTDLIRKDIQIIGGVAENMKAPIPLFAASSQLYLSASAMGFGERDMVSIIEVYRKMTEEAGVK